jgi:hypothetical protein
MGACGETESVAGDGGMELTPLLRIGDAEDGLIDTNLVFAEWQGFFAVSHISEPDQIQLFDSTGTFVRTVGRPGQGPGEFRSIRAMLPTAEGGLLVVDRGNARVSLISPDFAVEDVSRIDWSGRPYIGGYALLEGKDLLVNGFRRGSDVTSYVLRWSGDDIAWSLEEKEELLEDGIREFAVDEDGTIFVVRARHQFRIERVSPEGEVLEAIYPQRPWFDDWREQTNEGGTGDGHSGIWGPMAWIHDVAIRGDELWILGQTGDSRWREARTDGVFDFGLFTDGIVDVFDKRSGELLRSARFDVPGQLLLRFLTGDRILGYESGPLLNHLVVWGLEEAG